MDSKRITVSVEVLPPGTFQNTYPSTFPQNSHECTVPNIGAGGTAAPPRELGFIDPARIDHA